MFDDPKKELRRLEEALLEEEEEERREAEQTSEEGEGYLDQKVIDEALYGADQKWLDDLNQILEESEPEPEEEEEEEPRPVRRRKNPAVDYGKAVYEDEGELDEDQAVFDDEPKPKGIGCLLFVAILELLGILAIAGWWVKWLMG